MRKFIKHSSFANFIIFTIICHGDCGTLEQCVPDETTAFLVQRNVLNHSRYQFFWIISYGFVTPNIEPLSNARDALIIEKYFHMSRTNSSNRGRFVYSMKSSRKELLFNNIEIKNGIPDVKDICFDALPVDFYVVTTADPQSVRTTETLLHTCEFLIDDEGVNIKQSIILMVEGTSFEYDQGKARKSFLLKNLSMEHTTDENGLCVCNKIAECLSGDEIQSIQIPQEININIIIVVAAVFLSCIATVGFFKGLLNIKNLMTTNNRVSPMQ